MLDFCRRTFGGKAKPVKTIKKAKPQQEPKANTAQRSARQPVAASLLPAVQRLSRDQHAISRKDISPN
ncbi:MAG TPA: polynucleotide adenylyltransferase, partial [Rheinheimera sp.]|nr:polynucleotide adenylyltransferase [Rheinheimera sp.]